MDILYIDFLFLSIRSSPDTALNAQAYSAQVPFLKIGAVLPVTRADP